MRIFILQDITTNLLNNNSISKVKLISNQKGIIGGLEFAKQTFNLLDKNIKFHIKKKKKDQKLKRFCNCYN